MPPTTVTRQKMLLIVAALVLGSWPGLSGDVRGQPLAQDILNVCVDRSTGGMRLELSGLPCTSNERWVQITAAFANECPCWTSEQLQSFAWESCHGVQSNPRQLALEAHFGSTNLTRALVGTVSRGEAATCEFLVNGFPFRIVGPLLDSEFRRCRLQLQRQAEASGLDCVIAP